MIKLGDYRSFLEKIGESENLTLLAITIDKEMSRRLQQLQRGARVLFWLPPAAKSAGVSDFWKDANSCVLFVMEKYDPQREESIDVLERLQPAAEAVKKSIMELDYMGCSGVHPDLSSFDMMPETEFYGSLAGWSIGFKLITEDS